MPNRVGLVPFAGPPLPVITGLASAKPRNAETRPPNEPALDPKNFPLDWPIDLHWQPKLVDSEPSQPVDPNQPDSASEGTAL